MGRSLLPYLDQGALWRELQADPGFPLQDYTLNVLACPDDASATGVPGMTSYAVNAGYGGRVNPQATPTFLKDPANSSVIFSNSHGSTSSDGGRDTGVFWVDADVRLPEIVQGMDRHR